MTGIEQILLGFRDDYGIVRQIQPLLVKDIETRAVRLDIDIFVIENLLVLAYMEFKFIFGISQ